MSVGKARGKQSRRDFITLGTGVGGGIVAAGELLHGVAGCAGEVGHVTVDPNGFDCTCGKRGCLETVSSATGVVRVARHLSEEFAGDSELKQAIDDGQDVSSKDVFEFAEKGDHFAFNGCGSCLLLFRLSHRKLRQHVKSR